MKIIAGIGTTKSFKDSSLSSSAPATSILQPIGKSARISDVSSKAFCVASSAVPCKISACTVIVGIRLRRIINASSVSKEIFATCDNGT